MADWFHALTGFRERSWAETRAPLEVTGTVLRSRANGRAFGIGTLETPSLAGLHERRHDVPQLLRSGRRW